MSTDRPGSLPIEWFAKACTVRRGLFSVVRPSCLAAAPSHLVYSHPTTAVCDDVVPTRRDRQANKAAPPLFCFTLTMAESAHILHILVADRPGRSDSALILAAAGRRIADAAAHCVVAQVPH